jgi:hypothetical protein
MWMNEYEIDEAVHKHARHPVLSKATKFLAAFRNEVNRHSDGWPYWRPPAQAADKLMELIEREPARATEAELRKALTPIKRFYTTRGKAAGMQWPEEVMTQGKRYIEHLSTVSLTEALWWFIENVGEGTEGRTEVFFYLRERYRSEFTTSAEKMETGGPAGSRKVRKAKLTDDLYEESRYRSKEGWDGFHAGSIRKAMISACRLVKFTMALAKLSVFVEADGYDAEEPQVPLIRIYGDPIKQEDMARTSTGEPYVTVRAAYHDWTARVRIRWDADQFQLADVANLLSRVGQQVGIGEGRPDSKDSAGMGWGLFDVASEDNQ